MSWGAAFLAGLLSGVSAPQADCDLRGVSSRAYDADIRAAVMAHWAPHRRRWWCLVKAQAVAESSLRPDAVSPAGAVGLLQIMPATGRELGLTVSDLYDARMNIQASVRYTERLAAIWHTERPERGRLRLAMASYNAGPRSIIRAQAACGMARDWPDIQPCLESITGHHAADTTAYIDRIDRLVGR